MADLAFEESHNAPAHTHPLAPASFPELKREHGHLAKASDRLVTFPPLASAFTPCHSAVSRNCVCWKGLLHKSALTQELFSMDFLRAVLVLPETLIRHENC